MFPVMRIPAREIVDGDWIEGVGSVFSVFPINKGNLVFVTLSNTFDDVFYKRDDIVEVRIEDAG